MSDNVIYLKQPPNTDDDELKVYEVPYTLYASEYSQVVVEAKNKQDAYDQVMEMWNQGELETNYPLNSDEVEICEDEIVEWGELNEV